MCIAAFPAGVVQQVQRNTLPLLMSPQTRTPTEKRGASWKRATDLPLGRVHLAGSPSDTSRGVNGWSSLLFGFLTADLLAALGADASVCSKAASRFFCSLDLSVQIPGGGKAEGWKGGYHTAALQGITLACSGLSNSFMSLHREPMLVMKMILTLC